MWYRIVMVLLMVITMSFSQWRWANDSIKMTFDKEAHFTGSFGLYYLFKSKGFTNKQCITYTFYLGFTKECFDALLPWEKYGKIGGDGFSKYDLYYNIAGIGTAYIIDRLWKPKEDSKWERRFNYNGFSIIYRIY